MTFWSSSVIFSSVSSVSPVVKGFAVPARRMTQQPFILAIDLVSKHSRFLKLGKSSVPKMQMKYFALPRQEVVLNVEPVHGFEMAPKHGNRNQVRNRRRLIVPFLNRAQRRGARLQVRLVLFIPM